MNIEIEHGSVEYWYLLSMVGFYYPRIVAAALVAHERTYA